MYAAMKALLDSRAESIKVAARDHGVPITTLKNRLSGRVIHGTNPGPVLYLNSILKLQRRKAHRIPF